MCSLGKLYAYFTSLGNLGWGNGGHKLRRRLARRWESIRQLAKSAGAFAIQSIQLKVT